MGMRVEVVDPGAELELQPGDRGLVEAIDESGNVEVRWDRGFTSTVDPERTGLRRLAA